MSKLKWDQTGERTYEVGVSDTVLYPMDTTGAYSVGVAWNGISAVNESPSGAEPTKLYANNSVYATMMSKEEYSATIEAYTYPDEFAECDGSAAIATGIMIQQQERKQFGLCYKTLIGNDSNGTGHGYKLHLVYGCLASPSESAHSSIGENTEPETMSWEVSTTPVAVSGFKPTATLTIDSTTVDPADLIKLEAILYGQDAASAIGTPGSEGYVPAVVATIARLPLPNEIATIVTI